MIVSFAACSSRICWKEIGFRSVHGRCASEGKRGGYVRHSLFRMDMQTNNVDGFWARIRTERPVNQPTNQPTNQLIDQPTNHRPFSTASSSWRASIIWLGNRKQKFTTRSSKHWCFFLSLVIEPLVCSVRVPMKNKTHIMNNVTQVESNTSYIQVW